MEGMEYRNRLVRRLHRVWWGLEQGTMPTRSELSDLLGAAIEAIDPDFVGDEPDVLPALFGADADGTASQTEGNKQ